MHSCFSTDYLVSRSFNYIILRTPFRSSDRTSRDNELDEDSFWSNAAV